ncbi:MAG: HAD hydrolase-like protein, partial [Clostridia bacterium]|nr:HAD hydrolase-like protein [Clostridia bacterium]
MRCVIFDLDGTLTQSEEGIWNCVKYTADQMGFPHPDAETLRKFVGPPLKWSFMEYMGMTEEQAVEGLRHYRDRYSVTGLYENKVYPGIRTLLRMLTSQGVWCAVATGKPQDMAVRILEKFRLSKYLQRIIGPVEGSHPDKQQLIRDALPEAYDEAWMVGDTRFDMQGAHDVGIKALGVTYGYGTEEELVAAGAD